MNSFVLKSIASDNTGAYAEPANRVNEIQELSKFQLVVTGGTGDCHNEISSATK